MISTILHPLIRIAAAEQSRVYDHHDFDIDGVQWNVVDLPNGRKMIVVMGTDQGELRDWWANLGFEQIAAPGAGRVHRGYYEQALIVREHTQHLDVECYAGHSLGGAVSHILGALTGRYAVSFGAPRWGNKAACKRADDLGHIRFTLRGDKIPYIPFRWTPVEWFLRIPVWFARYSHVKTKVKLGKRKTLWNHAHADYHKATLEYLDAES